MISFFEIGPATPRRPEPSTAACSRSGPSTAKEFGRFALCEDDQGSSFGLHELPS